MGPDFKGKADMDEPLPPLIPSLMGGQIDYDKFIKVDGSLRANLKPLTILKPETLLDPVPCPLADDVERTTHHGENTSIALKRACLWAQKAADGALIIIKVRQQPARKFS
jgi:hypothetical protein